MCGSATFTTEVSSTSMKVPSIVAKDTIHLRFLEAGADMGG